MATKLALISGGSRGLGQALGASYSALGYRVVEFSRTAPHAWSVATDFASPKMPHVFSRTPMRALAAQAWDEIVVIHNAGSLSPIGAVANKLTSHVLANINTNITSQSCFCVKPFDSFKDMPVARRW